MKKDTAVATTTATLVIPDFITTEWLEKHFSEGTVKNYNYLKACVSRQKARDYLQEAINERRTMEDTACAVLTPEAKKPKSIKSKVKKTLGIKTT